MIATDYITQLAFAVHENRGVFALLLGSGVSRAASIPTGWEITLDLIRRVAIAQGAEDQSDWAQWYRETTGGEPDYSILLGELASSPEERRSILHSYIEPTEEDREEGRKTPTAAHYAIADLVRSRHIRLVVTTNFDRLIENALRERGVEPTIVSSVDALVGAEPILHSDCYLLKLHGDYKDARILNTDAELNQYPPEYQDLLDRILDEHGFIVCGWSGDWDHALRLALLRARNRRYSTFWAARGDLGSYAQELIAHRGARVIPVADADTFFSTVQQRVETLEMNRYQNPVSIDLLVSSTKRFLAKSEHRIQLDDLFAQETEQVLEKLDDPDFADVRNTDSGVFRSKVGRYEAIVEALAKMCGVLGRWSDGSEVPLVLDILRALYDHARKIRGGLVVLVGLRSYPALLIFTAYGIGLTRSERWSALHTLFDTVIDRDGHKPKRIVDTLFLGNWEGQREDAWKLIEGLERQKTPLSNYLINLFSEWRKDFIGLTSDLDLIFQRFEILASLAHFEAVEKSEAQRVLTNDQTRYGIRMPVGRSGWDTGNADKILAELRTEPMQSSLTGAGFAKGDTEIIDLFIRNFDVSTRRMRW